MPDIPNQLADKIKERFQKENNTLKRVVRDDSNDEKKGDILEVELGDAKQPDFKPQAKIKRWKNEVNFSLRRNRNWKNPKVRTESVASGGKVKVEDADEELHMYELEAGDVGEDGGLEVETILKKKPKGKNANQIEFTLETKGLDFFYQPELTEEEKKQGAERPDNVVGSYAAYHKTSKHNQYKTGKAFHIYRPKIIDDNGNEVWGELDIDEENNLLTVTVPQDFLNQAVYPVRVDPTFGYTSAGGTTTGVFGADDFYGAVFNAPEDGVVQDINYYAEEFDGNTSESKGVIVDYVDGSNDPILDNGVGNPVTISSSTYDWYKSEYNVKPTFYSSEDYILGYTVKSLAVRGAYDSGGTSIFGGANPDYSSPTSVTGTEGGDKVSVYANYQPHSYESTTIMNTRAARTFTQSWSSWTKPHDVGVQAMAGFMQFTYEADKYPNDTTYFDVAGDIFSDASADHSVDLALFDSNDNKVTGSEVTLSTTGGDNRVRSGSISLTDGETYHVKFRTNNINTADNDGVSINACRIIHQCEPTDTNFDFQDTYHMSLYAINTDPSSWFEIHDVSVAAFRNLWYDHTKWEKQPTFYLEAEVDKPNTNSPAEIRVIDEIDDTVEYSKLSITGSGVQFKRSGSFTISDDTQLVNIEVRTGGESVEFKGVRLIIEMPAPNNKFQLFHESPSNLFLDETSTLYFFGGYYWQQSAWNLDTWTFGGNMDFGSDTSGEFARYDGHYHFGQSEWITQGVDNDDTGTMDTGNVGKTNDITSDGIIVNQFNPQNSTTNIASAGVFWVEVQNLRSTSSTKIQKSAQYAVETTTTKTKSAQYEVNQAPNQPSNPSPADGSTGISTTTDLSADVSDPESDTMDVSFYESAPQVEHGNFQTASGSQTISTGFQPDVIVFRITTTNPNFNTAGTENGGDFGWAHGFASWQDGGITQNSVGNGSGSASTNGHWTESSSTLAIIQPVTDASGDNLQGYIKGQVTGRDSNGFTIDFTENNEQQYVTYTAYKFDGNDYRVGTFDTPTSTGTVGVTGMDFKPNFVQLHAVPNIETLDSSVNELSTGTDTHGWAHGVAVRKSDDTIKQAGLGVSQWSSNIDGHAYTSSSTEALTLAYMDSSKQSLAGTIKAAISAFNSDGFDVQYNTVNPSGDSEYYPVVFYVAAEANGQPDMGMETSPTSTGKQTYTTEAELESIHFIASNTIPSFDTESGVSSSHWSWMFGQGDVSTQQAMGFNSHSDSVNGHYWGSSSSEAFYQLFADQNASNQQQDIAQITNIDKNGFTLDWTSITTSSDGNTNYNTEAFIYFGFGSSLYETVNGVSSGSTVTTSNLSLESGKTYRWFVVAQDATYSTYGPTWDFSVSSVSSTKIQKSTEYSVETSTQKSKTAQYEVQTGTNITKPATYTVLTSSSPISKGSSYAITQTQPATSKPAEYAVQPTSVEQKSADYKIETKTAKTKSAEYKTQPESSITKSSAYRVPTSSQKTKGAEYKVETQPFPITQSAEYSTIIQQQKNLLSQYAVDPQPITKTKTAEYETQTDTAITKSAQYAVALGTTTETKSASYNVLLTDSKTKSGEYKVQPSTTKQKNASYKVQAQKQTQKSATYETQQQSAIAKSAQYAVPTTSSIAKSAEYDVAGTVTVSTDQIQFFNITAKSKTKPANYEIETSANITKSAEYDIAETITVSTDEIEISRISVDTKQIQKSATYEVQAQKTKTKSADYETQTDTAITKSARYAVPTTTQKTKPADYNVDLGTTTKTKSAEYRITQTQPISKGAEYKVVPETTKTKTATYGVLAEKTITKSAKYSTPSPGTITKPSQYAVPTTTTQTKPAEYRVKTVPTPESKTATYRVQPSTTKTKSANYEVPTTTTKTKSAQYAIQPESAVVRSAEYAVPTTTTKAKSAEYRVVESGTKTKSAEYRVQPSTTETKNATYVVQAEKTIQKNAKYEAQPQTRITKPANYEVPSTTKQTKTATYSVQTTPAETTKTAEYLVQPSTVETKTTTYRVVTSVTVTKSASYRIPGSNAIQQPADYKVETTPAVQQKVAEYRVETESTETKTAEYAVVDTKQKQKQATYRVQTTPAKTQKPAEYAVPTEASKQLSATYKVSAENTAQKQAEYKVQPDKEIQLGAKYTVPSTTKKTKSADYAIAEYGYQHRGDYKNKDNYKHGNRYSNKDQYYHKGDYQQN